MHHSISSIAQNADALAAVWSGRETTDLPYLWLRDNCGCSECGVGASARALKRKPGVARLAGRWSPTPLR